MEKRNEYSSKWPLFVYPSDRLASIALFVDPEDMVNARNVFKNIVDSQLIRIKPSTHITASTPISALVIS